MNKCINQVELIIWLCRIKYRISICLIFYFWYHQENKLNEAIVSKLILWWKIFIANWIFQQCFRTLTLPMHLVHALSFWWNWRCSFTFVCLYILFWLLYVHCCVCLFFLSSLWPWITFCWFLLYWLLLNTFCFGLWFQLHFCKKVSC